MDHIITNIIATYNLSDAWVASTGNYNFVSQKSDLYQISSPIDGTPLSQVSYCDEETYHKVMDTALAAKGFWSNIPAPKRGEVIRRIGNNFRKHKESLSQLITLEMGKTLTESRGEVQEVIDICDYAVGLSRQLYGFTMHSERPHHRMYEQYHPLGVVGIISAFNFPVAVWSWNAIIAAVCGNVSVWKPSETTPLCAIATQSIVAEILKEENLPEGIFNVVIGAQQMGQLLTSDHRIPLISATGSTEMGKKVGQAVAARLGKVILELGGNNAIIITPKADLKLALHASLFGVAGTAGQRCTSTRRIIIHESIYDKFKDIYISKFKELNIGNPLNESTLVGPLVSLNTVKNYIEAISQIKKFDHKILYGGNVLNQIGPNYVEPTIVEVEYQSDIVKKETFAPIVYLIKYKGDVREAIHIQNDVPQGLSSSIFTTDLSEAEIYLSSNGSDCGIANVNIGTSGAEIGGAFGGEKETGGGRESGSDSWKAYMRRQTNTINYSSEVSLAQGVKFEIN